MKQSGGRPLKQRKAADAAALAGLDPTIARLYAARGVTSLDALNYSLSQLAPVGSLERIDEAVALLRQHKDKRIIVIGDFDADGATSTALVLHCLREFGFADVDYLVPNRFDFGYGLTPEIVQVAAAKSPSLLVTVDNGVSSIEGVEEASKQGIEVLITDHHLPGKELPAARVQINPNLAGSQFRSPHLAGVGVAFYLMAALGRVLGEAGQASAAKIPARYLDLVALGTIADVVQLDHNNRILVRQGIDRIRAGRSVPGIRAILRQAGRSAERLVATDLGFTVGPRLNAAGRLEDMSVGIECLLTDDAATAARLAAELDDINRERRNIESTMREQAFAFVDAMDDRKLPACVCLYDQRWHQGVVGLIAARVRERCHRPVIAFAREREGLLKGSARSVPGVHIRDLLAAIATGNPGLIDKFGGHAMAAGLTLSAANFDAFSSLATELLGLRHPDADFSGAIVTDGLLPDDALNLRFARLLRESGPWGAGFPEPLFQGDFTIAEQRVVGEHHLRLRVTPVKGGETINAIAFNQDGSGIRGTVRLAFRLDVNEYRGFESPQLIVEQITAI